MSLGLGYSDNDLVRGRARLEYRTEEGEGLYRTDAFQFQMAGDWIMSVEVSTPDGRKTSTETFVTVAAR
mgnify:CR=1 FL=1